MFLEVSNLTKRFGEIVAVSGSSFMVDKGRFTTLLGPSGCGKTTTLRCIAGLEVPDKGDITMDGKLLFSSKSHVNVPPNKRHMGMVFQSYAIWPHMNVFENVAFPLKTRKMPSGEIKDRVTKILELVRLGGLEDRPTPNLSGGQQQRVALARSLVMEPKLLLLDEPLSNLDAKLRESMRSELQDLQRRLNITTVYVTHDQAEAFSLSDDIKVFIDGRIVAEGSPQQLYSCPGATVAEFLGCTNKLSAKVKSFQKEGDLAAVETPIGEILLRIPTNLKEGEDFDLYIRPSAISISPTRPSLGVNVYEGKIKRTICVGSDNVEYRINVNDQLLVAKATLVSDSRMQKKVFMVVHPEGGICVAK